MLTIMKTTHQMITRTQSFFIAALVAIVLLTTACNPFETVKGRGEVISENRSVGTFTSVEASGDLEVYLSQGAAQPVRVEGQDNILDVLETFVRNNELVIRYKTGVTVRRHEPVRIYIINPELNAVKVTGSGEAIGQTNWSVNDFRASVSGSGKLEITLVDAEDISSEISGSGNMYLKGNSLTHETEVSGSGNVRAFDLITKEAKARISGSGDCELTARDKLEARISGSGTIRYKGNPVIDSRITGSGRVVNMN